MIAYTEKRKKKWLNPKLRLVTLKYIFFFGAKSNNHKDVVDYKREKERNTFIYLLFITQTVSTKGCNTYILPFFFFCIFFFFGVSLLPRR